MACGGGGEEGGKNKEVEVRASYYGTKLVCLFFSSVSLVFEEGITCQRVFLCCFVGLLCYSFTPMILLFSAPFEIIFSFSVFVIMTDIL